MLFYGTAAMIDGIADRIEEELGQLATLVATGGLADIIIPVCKRKLELSEHLLLDGLRMIYQKIKYTQNIQNKQYFLIDMSENCLSPDKTVLFSYKYEMRCI